MNQKETKPKKKKELKTKPHLTIKERGFIEYALKKKTSVSEIAKALGYSRAALYYEIKKGTCEQLDYKDYDVKKVYLADYAQRVADQEASKRGRKKKLQPDADYLKDIKYWILEKKYSPYAARIKCGFSVCEKTIYNYIHAGYIDGLTTYSLPYARPKKKKNKQSGKRIRKTGKSIEERPQGAKDRSEYGHWEIDTVYSSKDDLHCLLTMTERMTREEITIKIKDRTALSVDKAMDRLEREMGTPAFREKFKTMTSDNGVEFSDWEYIEHSCRTKGKRTELYFAHPYCSSERGTNENHNRMIRRWIPKGDDIGLYSTKEIQEIQDWINTYPRRMYDGKSCLEYQDTLGF